MNNSEVSKTEQNTMLTDRQEGIRDLEKLLKSKKKQFKPAKYMQALGSISLLYSTEKRKTNETQMEVAENIARNLNKGVYFAKIIITW